MGSRPKGEEILARLLEKLEGEQRAGGFGLTAEALAVAVKRSHSTTCRRLRELVGRGLVVRDTSDGDRTVKWRLRRKGRR